MPDPSLRLPTTTFRAVLNLGAKTASTIPLPNGFTDPELDADWEEDTGTTLVYVHYPSGEIHLEFVGDELTHHFQSARGECGDKSPWPKQLTEQLVTWARALAHDVHALSPEFALDISEAAAWYDEGLPIYVCESEPVPLDLIEVEIEGEMMTLPWLGAGHVDHQHIDGTDDDATHPIELLWHPQPDETPDRSIAKAWLDPRTGDPRAAAQPGVDWDAVGLPADEVVPWLEGIYLNHHVLEDPESALLSAALRRMGGVDKP